MLYNGNGTGGAGQKHAVCARCLNVYIKILDGIVTGNKLSRQAVLCLEI